MKISSEAHYGLQAGIILAELYPNLASASELERRIGVSKKYLERIMRSLASSRVVVATRGASGGYALAAPPKEISVGDVIRPLEDELKFVDCVSSESGSPENCKSGCPSLAVWRKLYKGVNEILDSISLYEAAFGSEE